MNLFYTSIDRHGSSILFRGYDGDKRVKRKIEYQPTLYIPSPNPTDFRTLNNEYVGPIQPGSMRDCYEFTKKYTDVDNFKIYGMQNYTHQFASDMFLEKCPWNRSIIDVTSIDIEVASNKYAGQPNKQVKIRLKSK